MKEDTGWKYLTYRGTWIRILLAFLSGIMKQKSSRGRYLKCWEKNTEYVSSEIMFQKCRKTTDFFRQIETDEFSPVDLPYKIMLTTTTTKVCQMETKLYMKNLNVCKERKSIK